MLIFCERRQGLKARYNICYIRACVFMINWCTTMLCIRQVITSHEVVTISIRFIINVSDRWIKKYIWNTAIEWSTINFNITTVKVHETSVFNIYDQKRIEKNEFYILCKSLRLYYQCISMGHLLRRQKMWHNNLIQRERGTHASTLWNEHL